MDRAVAYWVLFTVATILVSCARSDKDAPEDTATLEQPGLPPEVQAQLDSGNAAYAEGRYNEALKYYQRVTELDSALSAGWFGVYMAQSRLGNQAAADSAMAKARKEEMQ